MPTSTLPATAPQRTFIVKLLKERDGFTLEFAERVEAAIGLDPGLTKTQASDIITFLMTKPKRESAKTYLPLPDVPAGHYALNNFVPDKITFYKVDRPTEGKWAGYTFVKHVVGGHPDDAVKGVEARHVLEAIIVTGIEASAVRYGVEIGRCYACVRDGRLMRRCHCGQYPDVCARYGHRTAR